MMEIGDASRNPVFVGAHELRVMRSSTAPLGTDMKPHGARTVASRRIEGWAVGRLR